MEGGGGRDALVIVETLETVLESDGRHAIHIHRCLCDGADHRVETTMRSIIKSAETGEGGGERRREEGAEERRRGFIGGEEEERRRRRKEEKDGGSWKIR